VKFRFLQSICAGLLLMAGFGLLVIGCFGGGNDGDAAGNVAQVQSTSATTLASLPEGLTPAEADELSTFKSKDPFIQQGIVVTTSTTPTSEGGGGGSGSSTTTYRPATTTTYYPGGGGTTTTTKPPVTTTTTAPHLHTLKVLSVGDVGGKGAVTFQVDSSVYKDKRIGDVVSTSWGQIKVLDISTSSKVVTLLQGSETLVLSVGQVVYE
jgi:hypothetical protein